MALSARGWPEYLDAVLLLGDLDLLHVDQTLRRKDSLLRRLSCGSHEARVLGGSEIEPPRGFRVYLEGVHNSSRDVNERACGDRCGVVDIFEVDGELSFYDVEGLIVLPMDVQRGGHPPRSELLY